MIFEGFSMACPSQQPGQSTNYKKIIVLYGLSTLIFVFKVFQLHVCELYISGV